MSHSLEGSKKLDYELLAVIDITFIAISIAVFIIKLIKAIV